MVTELAYGTWPSPLGPETLAAGGIRFGAIAASGDELWWLESRPSQTGRSVVVSARPGADPVDRLPAGFNARTRVHEYGGGAWWLGPQGASEFYFANWEDQRLYRHDLQAGAGTGVAPVPVPITPEPALAAGWRYADGRVHPEGQWLVCVREDHHGAQDAVGEPTNALVALPTDGSSAPVVIASATDFVSTPRFSPDGEWLSWIRWDHPNMPWDATELCVAPVRGTTVGEVQIVASGVRDLEGCKRGESTHGADWTRSGRLVFSNDRNGFWNLFEWSPREPETGSHALTDLELAEIGAPSWGFGTQRWAELDDGTLMAIVTADAIDSVVVLRPEGEVEMVATPELTRFGDQIATTGRGLGLISSGPKVGASVLEVQPSGAVTTYRPPDDLGIDPAWFSEPRTISFDEAHAFYYPPTAPGISGIDDEKPPLIVVGHGGPTGHSTPDLDLKVQYWTSRGFGVVDVNYRGSSGFGRAYRDLLQGQWGVADVEDCIGAAQFLADAGTVDPDRMAIRGSSAGGLTVLLALIQSEVFSAGTSLYGVADLSSLAADTHKFEARYLDGLIGRYPQDAAIYEERSPINNAEGLRSPMLIMQGTEDKVVPPSQSEAVVAALVDNGVAHAYVPFEGEQHGFRQAASVVRSLELELWFYAEVFGLALPVLVEAPEGAVGFGS